MTIASASGNPIKAEVIRNGIRGLGGIDGTDGQGFNNVRQSLLDSPLCRLFAPNKLADVFAGTFTATRSTTKKYVDRYGVVKTAAIDEIPEELTGFLIEGPSTNYLIYSDDLTQVAWSTIGTASAVINGLGPDGTTNASTVNLPALNDSITASSGQLSSNTTWTASCWMKGVVGETVALQIKDGTESSSNEIEVVLTDEWVRYQVTSAFGATGGTVAFVIIRQASQTATAVDVWGCQLENYAGASSVMSTSGATVTRAADDITLDVFNNAPSTSANFSIICNVIPQALNPLDLRYIVQIDNGFLSATLNTFLLLREGGSVLARLSTTGELNDASQLISGAQLSLAMVATSDSLKLYINGVLASEVTRTVFSENVFTSLFIGRRISDLTKNFYGNIRDLRFYDFAINEFEANLLGGV